MYTARTDRQSHGERADLAASAPKLRRESQPNINDDLRHQFQIAIDRILVELAEIRETLRAKRKEHLTVEEAAHLVGRAPYTVRTWISEGRLPATRVTGTGPRGRLLIRRGDLEALIHQGLGANISDVNLGS